MVNARGLRAAQHSNPLNKTYRWRVNLSQKVLGVVMC